MVSELVFRLRVEAHVGVRVKSRVRVGGQVSSLGSGVLGLVQGQVLSQVKS